MSTPTAVQWQWPADVLDFAVKHHVDGYLNPLLEATRRVYPTVRDIRVLLELDPELRDDWHIVFEVSVPWGDVPNYVEAQNRWNREAFSICPPPQICMFRLTLLPLSP